MNLPAPPSLCHDQAQDIERQVHKFLALLARADPHTRLTTLAVLRGACDQLLAGALVEGMAEARKDGWGLRRIAEASHYSHEQVRTLLARKADGSAAAERAQF